MLKPMLRFRSLAGAVALAAAALAAGAAAASPTVGKCQLVVSPASATWALAGYDPFSTSPLSGAQQVTFLNKGTAPCDFDVYMQTDAEPYGLAGLGGQLLPYSLVDNTDILTVTPFGGQTDPSARPHLHLDPGGQQMVQYSFIVDLSELPTDGTFDQRLLITAGSGIDILDQKRVDLTLQVVPSAVIGLRGAYSSSGGSAVIDLGSLKPGPAITMLQLYVQSTGGYRLDFDSANAGRLKLAGGAWAINYAMAVGGVPLDLSQGHPHLDAPRTGAARQDLLPIGFIIGDTSDTEAGNYQDVITVTVSAE
jgi:hypothetical protein